MYIDQTEDNQIICSYCEKKLVITIVKSTGLKLSKDEVTAILKELSNNWINRDNTLLLEMIPKMQEFVDSE